MSNLEKRDAERLARELAGLDRRVSAMARGRQIAFSTVTVEVEGETVERPVAELLGTVPYLDAGLSTARADIRAAEDAIDDLNLVKLPALQADLDAAEATIASHTTDLGTLDTRLDAAELDVDGAQADIATLNNTTIPALDSRITAAQTDLDAAEAELDTAQGDINTLNNTTIPDLNANLATKLPLVSGAAGSKTFRDVLSYNGGTTTANLCIETQITFGNYMTRIAVHGYNYNSTAADISLDIQVYTYAPDDANGPGTLINRNASSTGSAPVSVRFAKTNEATPRLVLILSPSALPSAQFAYPKITVPSAVVGNSTPPDSMRDGWTMVAVAEADLAARYVSISAASGSRDLNDTHTLTQGWRTTGTTTIDGGKITADSVTAGQIAANAVTANELAANAVYAGSIQANAVTANAIATDAVTANKIIADAVTAVKIAADAVTAVKIAADAVTAVKIAAGAVVAGKIAANAVTANEIAANAVTAVKIAADAVTAAKIAAGTITGNKIAANTIAAGSLLVGDFTNYFNDPTFSHSSGYSPWTKVGESIEKDGTGAQHGAYITHTEFPVEPGQKYIFQATRTTVAGTATGKASIHVQAWNGSSWVFAVTGLSMTADGVSTSAVITVGAGHTKYRLGFYTESDVPAGTRFKISNVSVRRQTGATLIEDGAITTAKVAASAVTADKMAAGTITAASGIIGDAAIVTAKIADAAITNAKVQGLSATKITTDTLGADRIGARSITADKIIVTDATNYWNDPTFAHPSGYPGWTRVNSGLERTSTAAQSGVTVTYSSHSVVAGDSLRVSIKRTDTGTTGGAVSLLARWYDAAGAQISFVVAWSITATGTSSTVLQVPANAVRVEWGIRMESSVPNGTTVRLTDFTIRRMNAGDMIVDGAITALKIGAGAVTAEKITAGAVTTVKLDAGAVTADKIATNAITADKIDANAIDGKTITGATVRTSATGDRIILANNDLDFIHFDGSADIITKVEPDAFGVSIKTETASISIGGGAQSGGIDWGGVNNLNVTNGTGDAMVEADTLSARERIVQAGEPIAYRQAAGSVQHTATINNGANAQIPVTFPTGRFTVPPNVNVIADSGRLTVGVQKGSVTTTGMTISVDNWSPGGAGASAADPITFYWQAVQMQTGAASG